MNEPFDISELMARKVAPAGKDGLPVRAITKAARQTVEMMHEVADEAVAEHAKRPHDKLSPAVMRAIAQATGDVINQAVANERKRVGRAVCELMAAAFRERDAAIEALESRLQALESRP